MLHFEVELEVAYELSSRLHYLHYITLHYITLDYLFTRFCFFFYLVCNFTWYVIFFGFQHVIFEQKQKVNMCVVKEHSMHVSRLPPRTGVAA